jgi:hypothetical protein
VKKGFEELLCESNMGGGTNLTLVQDLIHFLALMIVQR